MNTGTERRPFKVLRPAAHATAMVIARYSSQAALAAPELEAKPSDLRWRAFRLGIVCAACAFSFFVLSQRNSFKGTASAPTSVQVPTQRIPYKTPAPPAQPQALADAKEVTSAVEQPRIILPDEPNLKVTPFALTVSPEFQGLGNVELKLSGVNAEAQSFDLTVKTRGREFYRQDIKLNEHIQVARHRRHGPEVVVQALAPNRVWGYLSEPIVGYRPSIRAVHHRWHRRRRA